MAAKGRRTLILLFHVLNLTYYLMISCYSYTDTIIQGQQLKDWEHLTSANNVFKLQFFSPGKSRNRYLGIFYIRNQYMAVWVGNRNSPIPDASGNLMIDVNGKLKLVHSGGTNAVDFDSGQTSANASATLLDNGNFVLREINLPKRVLWQSFDYPTDTYLPGMKLGVDLRTGHQWSLTSWRSYEVPASGSFTLAANRNDTSQLVIMWRNNITWNSGPWQNGRFENAPNLSFNEPARNFKYVSRATERYFTYTVPKDHVGSHYRIDESGNLLEGQGAAALFGVCFLAGLADPGCVPYERPQCRKPDSYVDIRRGYIFGDTYKFDESRNLSRFDCDKLCWRNCSCAGYATAENGTGCEIFFSRKDFKPGDSPRTGKVYIINAERGKWWVWLIVGVGSSIALLLCFSCYVFYRKLRAKGKTKSKEEMETLLHELAPFSKYSKRKNDKGVRKMSHELRLLSFESVSRATDNFSSTNKLGQGGFGPVYKGILDGQEVAVKQLSRSSGQGIVEFKNEIQLIANLQHTNLVRLLGCCIEVEEKALVYEYMPNKSLDFFIFDPQRKELLKWTQRFNIIEGIAQGLLYLHKYSRLRIIHRDLKASNILLDNYLNPKISDFGMAKIFGINVSVANTNRVVGTYGYMSPEYAMYGIVSRKTDVFSFGILLLEIVSSKKNNDYYDLERPLNLIGLAWELWKEGKCLELMDPALEDSCSRDEVIRCIHVGLLCVQDHAADRPLMSDVVSMLTNEHMDLRIPKQPAFFIDRHDAEKTIDENLRNISNNDLSISDVEAR